MIGSITSPLSVSFGASYIYRESDIKSQFAFQYSNMIVNPMLCSSSTDWKKSYCMMENDKVHKMIHIQISFTFNILHFRFLIFT